MCDLPILQCVEVSCPKTLNIKQYLNANNFSVNNRYFGIKSSQAALIYITKVFLLTIQFAYHIQIFFVTNTNNFSVNNIYFDIKYSQAA